MKRVSQWIILILMLGAFAGAYWYVTQAIEAKKNQVARPRPPAKEQVLDISVVRVSAQSYASSISAYGTAKSRYELTLNTTVSGEVSQLDSGFESGQQVAKDQILARLKNTDLVAKLTQAQNQVAQAELTLKEEQRQANQAKLEWEAAGLQGQPASDLVLREPQLAVARSAVAQAKANLVKAQDDVNKLVIKAPFNAIVINRNVSPGAYVQSSTNLADLYSIDRVEIQLPLAPSDWAKLPPISTLSTPSWPVSISAVDQNSQWQGYVLRAEQHVQTDSRLRNLIIALDNPLSAPAPLIPGSFVKVTLQGKSLPDLWRLPTSALSQKGEIWYLDGDKRLQAFSALPIFTDANAIYIRPPKDLIDETQSVLVQPYNSYIKGALANPIEVANP